MNIFTPVILGLTGFAAFIGLLHQPLPHQITLTSGSVGLITHTGIPITLDFNSPTLSPSPTPTATATLTPSPTQKPTATTTPSPTPKPTVAAASPADLDGWFTKYAGHYSVNQSLLRKIAVCESGYRAAAVNGIYGGMFQFSPNTWMANRRTMGMDGNPDLRFSPEEAIRTAAFVLSTRGPSAWPACSRS